MGPYPTKRELRVEARTEAIMEADARACTAARIAMLIVRREIEASDFASKDDVLAALNDAIDLAVPIDAGTADLRACQDISDEDCEAAEHAADLRRDQ